MLLKSCLFQDGDVIELCQVSDIRAGGLPKVRKFHLFMRHCILDSLFNKKKNHNFSLC